MPVASTVREPEPCDQARGASVEAVNTDSVIGRNASPACIASSWSTCWRYSVRKNHIENNAA